MLFIIDGIVIINVQVKPIRVTNIGFVFGDEEINFTLEPIGRKWKGCQVHTWI